MAIERSYVERRATILQEDKSIKRQVGAACRKIADGIANAETIPSFGTCTFRRRDETPNKKLSNVARATYLRRGAQLPFDPHEKT